MKSIQTFLSLLYNILSFLIVVILLLGIIIKAENNSWYYLLLYIPILLFIYKSEAMDFRKKKHTRLTEKKI
ncbi:MAG: hypothetical protein M3O67_05395 [Bacteroidota bacterium]|nr:hypothetical protein [Bacteroidota bacterium]